MRTRWTVAGLIALALTAGGAQVSTQEMPRQHPSGAAPKQMDHMQMMMAEMHANTAKLDDLLTRMNAATGADRLDAMADVIAALVKERVAMAGHMQTMQVGTQMADMMTMHESGVTSSMMHSTGTSHGAAPVDVLDIAFKTNPAQLRLGENTLEVTVTTHNGEPVTDAVVSVIFFMPPMPKMNMPEMKSTAMLKHDASGIYRGTGQVVMAGRWDVTVTVSRAGKELGRKSFVVSVR